MKPVVVSVTGGSSVDWTSGRSEERGISTAGAKPGNVESAEDSGSREDSGSSEDTGSRQDAGSKEEAGWLAADSVVPRVVALPDLEGP